MEKKDLRRFVQLAKDRKCLDTAKLEFELDPVTVIVDDQGRVYHSGANPRPYKLRMRWCHLEVDAEGKVNVVAAKREPPWWGFRLRLKAHLGYHPLAPLYGGHEPERGLDAGLMLDFFYVSYVNVNATAGVRGVGLGAGVDLTRNFGLYAGYSVNYAEPLHGFYLSTYFAF